MSPGNLNRTLAPAINQSINQSIAKSRPVTHRRRNSHTTIPHKNPSIAWGKKIRKKNGHTVCITHHHPPLSTTISRHGSQTDKASKQATHPRQPEGTQKQGSNETHGKKINLTGKFMLTRVDYLRSNTKYTPSPLFFRTVLEYRPVQYPSRLVNQPVQQTQQSCTPQYRMEYLFVRIVNYITAAMNESPPSPDRKITRPVLNQSGPHSLPALHEWSLGIGVGLKTINKVLEWGVSMGDCLWGFVVEEEKKGEVHFFVFFYFYF